MIRTTNLATCLAIAQLTTELRDAIAQVDSLDQSRCPVSMRKSPTIVSTSTTGSSIMLSLVRCHSLRRSTSIVFCSPTALACCLAVFVSAAVDVVPAAEKGTCQEPMSFSTDTSRQPAARRLTTGSPKSHRGDHHRVAVGSGMTFSHDRVLCQARQDVLPDRRRRPSGRSRGEPTATSHGNRRSVSRPTHQEGRGERRHASIWRLRPDHPVAQPLQESRVCRRRVVSMAKPCYQRSL